MNEEIILRKLSAAILLLTTASSLIDDIEQESKLSFDKKFKSFMTDTLRSVNAAKIRLVGNKIEQCRPETKAAYGEDIVLLERLIEVFVNDIESCEEITKGIEVNGQHYHLRDYLAGFENGRDFEK